MVRYQLEHADVEVRPGPAARPAVLMPAVQCSCRAPSGAAGPQASAWIGGADPSPAARFSAPAAKVVAAVRCDEYAGAGACAWPAAAGRAAVGVRGRRARLAPLPPLAHLVGLAGASVDAALASRVEKRRRLRAFPTYSKQYSLQNPQTRNLEKKMLKVALRKTLSI